MADNLTTQTAALATVPTASAIATDDVAGAHFQKVKLADGTADSSAMIPGDATNGLDVDVTRLPALVAGTANIGDVDVLTVPAPLSTTGGGTEATALRVTVANDSTGVLSVDDNAGSLTVDGTVNIGTFPDNEPFNLNQLGGTALAVPFDVDSGAGTQSVIGVSVRKAASGGSVEYGTSADPIRVDPTGTTTQPVSGTVTVTEPVSVDDNAGSLTVDNAALSVVGGGVEATALRVTVANDSTGVLSVDDNGAALTVDNGGTFATQVDGAALTALQLIDDPVFADDAAFTVGTSKVMASGGQAVAHGANPDAADALDAVVHITNRHRVPFTIGGHPNIVTAVYNTTAAQTDDAVVAAVGAGTKIVVTRATVALDDATTVGVGVRIGFGATTLPALGASGADGVAGLIFYHPGMVPGSILQVGDGSGMLGVGADGEDLRVTCEVPTTGTLAIAVSYYTIES